MPSFKLQKRVMRSATPRRAKINWVVSSAKWTIVVIVVPRANQEALISF